MSVLDAAIAASMAFVREGLELPELRLDEKTFVGLCFEIWTHWKSTGLEEQLMTAPTRDWIYTAPARWGTHDVLATPVDWHSQITISKSVIENGLKIAAPKGWLWLKLTDAARAKMLLRFER